jgi:hypothetical protein
MIPTSLVDLCTSSGGEVAVCRSLKDMQTVLRNLAFKLTLSSVDVRFGSDTDATSLSTTSESAKLVRLKISGPGEWPIPESFWISQITENFIPRQRHPVLTIAKGMTAESGTGSGTSASTSAAAVATIAPPKYFLKLAKELDLAVDSYEVIPAVGASYSVNQSLGITNEESYHVYVKGSGPTQADIHSILAGLGGAAVGGGLAAIAASTSSITSTGGGGGLSSPPFAIIRSGRVATELIVLPFNYPIILPLMHRAWDALRTGTAAGLPASQIYQQPWAHLWRQELTSYLWTVPVYYYNAVQLMLKRVGLKALAQLQPLDVKLHRTPFKHIQRAIILAEAGTPICSHHEKCL